MATGRILVYGGKGALGSACVKHFKNAGFWVLSVDLVANDDADVSVLVPAESASSWVDQDKAVRDAVGVQCAAHSLDAVLCAAGGWAGGNVASADLAKTADLMWKQSCWSSVIAAGLASQFLKEHGLLYLTGAEAALRATPTMVGYGLAKAAVHQFTKSLADPVAAGLPSDVCTVALLPVTLDTPMNRKWMPKADHSKWTPLSFVAEKLLEWTTKAEARPQSGSLLRLLTADGQTHLEAAAHCDH